MNEKLQPEIHPDADQISTFVEGAAKVWEREQMLAHLADCAECRRVVFLMKTPEDIRAVATGVASVSAWRRWLIPAGLATAALACGLLTVVYLRTHRGIGEIRGQSARVQTPELPRNEALPVTGGGKPESATETRARARRAVGAGAERQLGRTSGGAARTEQQAPMRPENAVGAVAAGVAGESAAAAAEQPVPRQQPAPAEVKPLLLGERNAAAPAPNFAATKLPALQIEHDRGPQDGTTEVKGVVTDQTGALVAGATVTLRNAAGTKRETTSSAGGSFDLTEVPPGHYELKVAAGGFESYAEAIDLKPRDMAMLNAKLSVGAASQTVAVQADALTLQTDSNVVSTPMSSEQISENATENRNFAALAALPIGTTATLGRRVLALDSAGALLVSRDGGKSWKKVKPRWSGKVARIETVNVGAGDDLRSEKSKASGGENARQVFQLTTESGSVWTSDDGVHWRPR